MRVIWSSARGAHKDPSHLRVVASRVQLNYGSLDLDGVVELCQIVAADHEQPVPEDFKTHVACNKARPCNLFGWWQRRIARRENIRRRRARIHTSDDGARRTDWQSGTWRSPGFADSINGYSKKRFPPASDFKLKFFYLEPSTELK